MGNHCVPTVCRECGYEFCLRCYLGICPKCGTPWNAQPKTLTVYDHIGKNHNMTTDEIYKEAELLGKTEKIKLVNRILASIKDTGRADARGASLQEPPMPVYEGLTVFAEIYREKKGVAYTMGKFTQADFKNMKELILKISDRLSEGGPSTLRQAQGSGTVLVTDTLRIDNLKAFLLAVCAMKNQWYYENRFNPYGLNNDFEKIYSTLVNNSDHARRKRAFDCL